MVARFRCLLLGEPPAGHSTDKLLRVGIDGVIVPTSSAVVTAGTMPCALHLTKQSPRNTDLSQAQLLLFDQQPLVFVERNMQEPPGTSAFEVQLDKDAVVGQKDRFPIVRVDRTEDPASLRALVAKELTSAVESTLSRQRENTLVVLAARDEWSDEDLQALDLGLIDGAAALPPRAVPYYFPPSTFTSVGEIHATTHNN